jgi:hypothetical protein
MSIAEPGSFSNSGLQLYQQVTWADMARLVPGEWAEVLVMMEGVPN